MDAESPSESARNLARLILVFEDMAADIRRGAVARGLTLSEVRLLDGVARGVCGARRLSQQLRLDEGHVSRMVKRMRAAGLLTARRQAGDGRRVILGLTSEGALRLAESLEGAAYAAEAALGEGLSSAGPSVAAALESLLDAAPPSPEITLAPLGPGDAGWVVAQHGKHYASAENFDATFEAMVAQIVADFILNHDPEREVAWIARAGGERVGCVFCVAAQPGQTTSARLRLFLVRPEWRRQGLGRRLLDTCHDFAARSGYAQLVLHTHREHAAACRLYDACGFARTESRPVTAYGRNLTEQIWVLPLDAPLANPAAHR